MGKQSHKIRIGVIFGGRSGEHEVSLNSARSVMKALDPAKYEVVQIGITPEGQWLTGEAMLALSAGSGDAAATALVQSGSSETQISKLTAEDAIDVVFPVLHGTFGEDGTVQGLLELAGVPYVGAGVVGSAVGMDKAVFKQVMTANHIPVLPWQLVLKSQWVTRPQAILAHLEETLTYPVFTKPANLGSSVGISKCRHRDELCTGLDEAARFDRRIVVEQGINARELEVSVLGNDDPIASIVGEVRPRRDFYDYVAKYVSDDSELLIPAPISKELASQVRVLAVQAYQAIDCAGLGRVDMLLDKDSGAVYLNEINTIPGFTQISMYPKLWEATGLSYPELLDKLVALALERFEEKERLTHRFEVTE